MSSKKMGSSSSVRVYLRPRWGAAMGCRRRREGGGIELPGRVVRDGAAGAQSYVKQPVAEGTNGSFLPLAHGTASFGLNQQNCVAPAR